ncbi:MAG TPA: SPOR domain-containing protein [Methylotenera sp.]|nr:SPOR domain-containing protein [Methylotenera sp.]
MQREPVSDLELNLKKRARRRLVGAIALVLLMVIVLPMILKDRAAISPAEKITITLPNEQSQPAPSDFDSSIVPAEPSDAVTDETKPEASPEKEANTASRVDTEATAPAKETSAKVTAGGKFYVQVGVFSDAANVKQLQAKLTDLGYKSQTEKISTDKGQKIRLRTQVFGDRNEAAIALENIKDAGLTGMVVSQ